MSKRYIRDRKINNYTPADAWKVLSQYLQALINTGDDLESQIEIAFLTAALEANWNTVEVNSSCVPLCVLQFASEVVFSYLVALTHPA